MRTFIPYNPLDRVNLAASAAEALLTTEPEALDTLQPFAGAGVYAIYYSGGFAPYDWIKNANADGKWLAPIYVGKAIPKGGRKGGFGLDAAVGTSLLTRLNKHAESIRAATTTLNIADFHCRFLVADDIWIPLIETLMISRFSPIWNNPVEGFGNHDPGSGRYNGLRPRWDVLHPGRAWADKCKQRSETADTISGEVAALLAARPIPNNDMIHPDGS
jgi:hypothetical protein